MNDVYWGLWPWAKALARAVFKFRWRHVGAIFYALPDLVRHMRRVGGLRGTAPARIVPAELIVAGARLRARDGAT